MSDNVITINSLMNVNSLLFYFSEKDDILSVKNYILKNFKDVEVSNVDEIELIINEYYPYPLNNNLKLPDLLEEHRSLNLIIKENTYRRRLISKRNSTYLSNEKVDLFDVINLCNMYESDLDYIQDLLVEDYKHIEIDCKHSIFYKIINELNKVNTLSINIMVLYNYDENDFKIVCSVLSFITIKQYKCFNHIKVIDYDRKRIII